MKHVIEIASDEGRNCEHCGNGIGSFGNGLAASINHYTKEHGYTLIDVGTQTSRDSEGKPWHRMIAVMGHDNPPAVLPPQKVILHRIKPDDVDVKLK